MPAGTFYQLSLYDTPEKIGESAFDLAVSTEVIEHLYRPSALLDFAWQKLKDGGYFIVTTPYNGWRKNIAVAVTGRWDQHHQPWHDGGHIKFWSRASLTALLEQRGFEVVAFIGRMRWLWKSMIAVARKPERTSRQPMV